MSTGLQRSLNEGSGNSSALSLLDEKILAMIRAQSPLRWTLDVLCSDLEKQHQGMLCSILFLAADGVTLRNGASPVFRRNTARQWMESKSAPAPDRAGLRSIESNR